MSKTTATKPATWSSDRSGEIDPILYGRLCAAHSDAEEYYVWIAGVNGTYNAWNREIVIADGKAEGLALAVAIVGGGDVVEIRTRVQQKCRARRAAGIRSVEQVLQSMEEFDKPIRAAEAGCKGKPIHRFDVKEIRSGEVVR